MNFICRQTQALTEAIRNYSDLRMRFRNGVLRDPDPPAKVESEQKSTSSPTQH